MHRNKRQYPDVSQMMGGPGGPGGGRHHRGGRHRQDGPDFGFGPGFGRGFGRGGGRRARGDVRSAALLLLDEEPRNGYALMQAIEERSDGAWRPSPGSIYPVLQQLEDERLVTVQEGGSGRTFALTDEGRAHVTEHRDELGKLWETVSRGIPENAVEIGDLVRQIAKAAMEVVRSGTPEQRTRAVERLTETRRGLYLILAEDEAK
ncbi:MAG TPA: PadR family transcriptional regulator [Solirubrobacteraceae bacterium]|nr:PadR family transcriptional regulator [Solirubrobacteraceae bacterium]